MRISLTAILATVRQTGTLTPEQMMSAYTRAHRRDPSIPALRSPRSLLRVNEAYINL